MFILGGRVGFCSYNYKFYEEDEVGIDKIELPDTDKILAQSDKEVREFLDDVKILKPTNLVALTRMWNEL